MIKINLLPVQSLKKKEGVKVLVMTYLFLFLGSVICCALLYFLVFQANIQAMDEEIVKLTEEKATTDKEVQAFERQQADTLVLAGKAYALNLLEDTRRNKVKMLRDIPTRIPKEQVWLTNLVLDEKGSWSCKGVATDTDPIAQTLSNLEKSSYFINVRLVNSVKQPIGKMSLMSFDIMGSSTLIANVIEAVSSSMPAAPKDLNLTDIGNKMTRVNPSLRPVMDMNKSRVE